MQHLEVSSAVRHIYIYIYIYIYVIRRLKVNITTEAPMRLFLTVTTRREQDVRVRLTLFKSYKHTEGSTGVVPLILNFVDEDEWSTLRSLYPRGKSSQHPLNKRFVGPKRRSGCFGNE